MTIYPSLHGTVDVPATSITETLFEGLDGREDEVAVIDGPSGRTITAGALNPAAGRRADRARRAAGRNGRDPCAEHS